MIRGLYVTMHIKPLKYQWKIWNQ